MDPITIKIDGDDVELRCTPGAMRALCRKYNNLQAVEVRIPALDFFLIVDVVEAGVGPRALKDLGIKREALEDKIYEARVITLIKPLTKFIGRLANGGNDFEPGNVEDGDEGNG